MAKNNGNSSTNVGVDDSYGAMGVVGNAVNKKQQASVPGKSSKKKSSPIQNNKHVMI